MNKKLKKRLRNWKTWVALFGATGLTLQAFGIQGFEGTLGHIQDAVYLYGIALGLWTDHEAGEGNE
ncbi:hypothetical protein ABEO79_00055 [Micromonospora provocatoris]